MPTQFKVLCVAAARPNFMKVKPVLDALERRAVETVLVHTGQHFDAQMGDVFFSDIGLPTPDRSLGSPCSPLCERVRQSPS
jgi:UDP-N-acetylglucosamine 2-epimerase (non-hydrolysing)